MKPKPTLKLFKYLAIRKIWTFYQEAYKTKYYLSKMETFLFLTSATQREC